MVLKWIRSTWNRSRANNFQGGGAGQTAKTNTSQNKQTNKPTTNGKLERIIIDMCTGEGGEEKRENENNANKSKMYKINTENNRQVASLNKICFFRIAY